MNVDRIDHPVENRYPLHWLRRSRCFAVGILISALVLVVSLWPVSAAAQDMKPQTLEKVKHASLMVFNAASQQEKGDTKLGSGSGYFINSTGLLITNNHVVDPGHGKSAREKWKLLNQYNLLVQTIITDAGTDDEKTWECELLYTNEAADQALLQALDEEGDRLETPNYLRFLPESQLEDRLHIVALGFPGGDSRKTSANKHPEVNVVEGQILEHPRSPGGRIRRIYTDAELRAGNSGGPVVSIDGLLVGTLTLGISNENRRNYNALVPAAVTREFIRAAFTLGKVPAGIDYAPLMEMLPTQAGRMNISEHQRQRDRDVLFFDNGDRIYGTITTDTIPWDSSLGTIHIPASAVAYVMNNEEGSHLFLEGGNHLAASSVDAKFRFQPEGGTVGEYPFDSVDVIAWKLGKRQFDPVSGDVLVLDTESAHLVLTGVQGTSAFEGRMGKINIKLPDIKRVEHQEDGTQVVVINDGRRMTGRFVGGGFEAVIAATHTPITFNLNQAKRVTIQKTHRQGGAAGGLDLPDVLVKANKDVQQMVRTLQNGDLTSARATIDTMKQTSQFKRLPKVEKEHIWLVDAACLLRQGQYDPALKTFRKCAHSVDDNIRAYAMAAGMVLKRFPDHQYGGKPFSDKAAFSAAGIALSNETVREVRSILKDAADLKGKSRGEYARGTVSIKKYESILPGAAIFRGTIAEDELLRLWKLGTVLCQRELQRLDESARKAQDAQRGSAGNRRRGAGARLFVQRQKDELAKKREEVQKKLNGYNEKRFSYGFRVEDADIQAMREAGDRPATERDPSKNP